MIKELDLEKEVKQNDKAAKAAESDAQALREENIALKEKIKEKDRLIKQLVKAQVKSTVRE